MTYLTILLFSILDVEPVNSIDYIIAEYLLLNEDKIYGISLSQISKECNVSKASISRFCRRIGCLDYVDLQIMIRSSINKKKTLKKREKLEPQEQSRLYFEACASVNKFLESVVVQKEVQSLIQDLYEYENIAIFGHLQSGDIAFQLRHDMSRLGKLVYSTTSLTQQEEYIINADNQNLIIIFSATGRYFTRFINPGKLSDKKKKPRIYMITTAQIEEIPDFVSQIIALDEKYDRVFSHVAMNQFVNYISYMFD